jgi:hypothetical protein
VSTCPSCGGIIGRDCWNPQECASITADMHRQQGPSLAGEPVAWRVKDFAEGWILCHSEEQARREAQAGNLIEPLYALSSQHSPSVGAQRLPPVKRVMNPRISK